MGCRLGCFFGGLVIFQPFPTLSLSDEERITGVDCRAEEGLGCGFMASAQYPIRRKWIRPHDIPA